MFFNYNSFDRDPASTVHVFSILFKDVCKRGSPAPYVLLLQYKLNIETAQVSYTTFIFKAIVEQNAAIECGQGVGSLL